MKGIEYTVQDGEFKGKRLTGGSPEVNQGIAVVRFEQKHHGKILCMKIEGRPTLAALVDEYNASKAAEIAEYKAAAEEALRKREEMEAPLIAAMKEQAGALRKQIPAGMIEVTVKENGSFDGYPNLTYFAPDGTELRWDDTVTVGWASATRPGAMAPFESVCISYISPEKLAEKMEVLAEEARVNDEKEAAEKVEKQAREELRSSLTIEVMKRGKSRGEEDDPFAEVKVTDPNTGESLKFCCRNIFDFGYTVNPMYAVAPGKEQGGMASNGNWMDFENEKGWLPVRPLTPFESQALEYLHQFPPVYDGIRM